VKGCGRKIGPYDCCTVVCGDCLELMKDLPDGCVDAVITDPPYGVGAFYHGSYRDKREGYWDWFLPCIRLMRSKAPVVAFTHRIEACRHIQDWQWIGAWIKPWSCGAHIGNSPILPHWEPIFMWGIHSLGVKNARADVFRFNPAVGSGANGKQGRELMAATVESERHPRPKPVQLYCELIATLTRPGQTILDPFLGRGTTAVAAKKLRRHFLGFEISPEYCRITEERLALVAAQPNLFVPKTEQMELEKV
jgi:site-specific DNA-methyltransferase (adenine-specific)